ncbi:hypothetical protein FB451DRAFT_1051600 [Mycena latifolia]|nr:hypothetical protein FB451DRAFT_1051600 [Mycena latifolia]
MSLTPVRLYCSLRGCSLCWAGCTTGAFYSSPTLASSYDAMSPLTISWQPALSCLLPPPSLVDIYLYAPGQETARVHIWEGVPYSEGSYSATLMPRWWNATSSINLQLMVVASGTPPFLSTIPAGPVFTATYTANGTTVAPAADTSLSGSDSGTTVVTATKMSGVSSHKLSHGATAAAVLLPLLFVLLLGAAYLKISRARGAAKRSAWSEKLDKRMSTISADWKAITPGGAKVAVRQSLAARDSSAFSFGATGTSSHVDADPVVMGEKPRVSSEDLPRTSLGSGVGVGVGARRPRTHAAPPDRGSRAVSFADSAHPRPSMTNSVYSRQSRAFHTASTYGDFAENEAPPVPALPSPSRTMTSPRQTAGPLTLTPDDIRRRMTLGHGQQNQAGGEWRQSVDEVFGALSMMRTGADPTSPDATDGEDGDPASPPMPSAAPASPFAMPMSAPTMSPDDMLRAYAATHTATGSPIMATKPLAPLGRSITRKTSKPTFVSPLSNSTAGAEVVSTYTGTGMRVLYAQPEEGAGGESAAGARGSGMIRAGPGARLSR